MLDFLERVLTECLLSKSMSTIVQIGANDGRINDPIFEIVNRYSERNRILLIEPQAEIIPYLGKNYSNHQRAVICNAAIGPEKTLTLYRVKPSLHDIFIRRHLVDSPAYRVPSGFTSAIKSHVYGHTRGNLPSDIALEEAIETIEVPCFELKVLIHQLGWEASGLDFLQIDTEGMDDLVLHSCNIELLRPALINFEHSHLPEPRAQALANWLCDLGYSLVKWSASDTLAVRAGHQLPILKRSAPHNG